MGLLLLLGTLAASWGGASGQSREWWDLYADARKAIESSGSSEDALKSARRDLQTAIRSQGAEGNLPTYNPSVRIDYLPWFYLGWAELRLGRYEEAGRAFKKSEELGFITKDAPREDRERFGQLSRLVVALEPAAGALDSAKKNASVKECMGGIGAAAGGPLREAIGKLESLLASPTDAGSLEAAVKSLDSAVGGCVREVAGARIAQLSEAYRAAREAVSVQGVASLLGAGVGKEIQDAVTAGDQAEGRADEKGMRAATDALVALKSKVPDAVDARLAALAKEASTLSRGNEGTLDQADKLASRLAAASEKARSQKASGKSGAALGSVVASGIALEQLVGEARRALQPILQAGQRSLTGARGSFEGWMQSRSCEIQAVGAMDTARRALAEADAALKGASGDAMAKAESALGDVRKNVEANVAVALPRARQQASGIVGSADSVLSNVADEGQKERGRKLKEQVEQVVGGGDICAIDKATASLRSWVGSVAPALEQGRQQAIARNEPQLFRARTLLDDFGFLLEAGTLEALRPPAEKLADLLKNSYDTAAIDAAGSGVKEAAERAEVELRGQMRAGLDAVETIRKGPRWQEVEESRRRWIESSLPDMSAALAEMNRPDLLARFAREGPRARIEVALLTAFDFLYARNDPASAAKTLEDLGPALRAQSAALNFGLSYVYWW